jgi:hypothetical protein
MWKTKNHSSRHKQRVNRSVHLLKKRLNLIRLSTKNINNSRSQIIFQKKALKS